MSTAGSFGWSAIVAAAWPWISGVLYHGRFEDIGSLAYLWGANVMLGSIALALNVAMLALGEFKRLALLDLAGAVVTAVAIFGLLARFDYPFRGPGDLDGPDHADRPHGAGAATPAAAAPGPRGLNGRGLG